nr:GNAT family N-acetyltransferase [Pantoea allii]
MNTVAVSIEKSLTFGVYDDESQIGFARLVTDYATFAWLNDVYILEEYQGKGLSRWLMASVHGHPVFIKLRKILPCNTTAPWLYKKLGYEPVNQKNFIWTIIRPDIYAGNNC